MTTRRTFISAAMASAVAATLAACGKEAPTTPTATGSAEARPVLDGERLTAALARIEEGMTAADGAKSADALAGYLIGPAARIRGEEYVVATATADDSLIRTFTTASQAGAVGLTTDFPRTAVVVTKPASEGAAPFMLILNQEAAREDFQMWSWTQLFGGVEIPATATASVGSEQITADSADLVNTPQAVLEAYVDALNTPDGANGTAFADDVLRQRIAAERAVDLGGMGTVSVAAAAGSDGVKGVRTAEGGALVTTTLTFSTTYKRTVAGSTLTLGGAPAKMLGDDANVVGTVQANYDVMVSFSIPSASAGGQPVVLGVELVLASVARDDSQAPAEG